MERPRVAAAAYSLSQSLVVTKLVMLNNERSFPRLGFFGLWSRIVLKRFRDYGRVQANLGGYMSGDQSLCYFTARLVYTCPHFHIHCTLTGPVVKSHSSCYYWSVAQKAYRRHDDVNRRTEKNACSRDWSVSLGLKTCISDIRLHLSYGNLFYRSVSRFERRLRAW